MQVMILIYSPKANESLKNLPEFDINSPGYAALGVPRSGRLPPLKGNGATGDDLAVSQCVWF